MRTYCKDGKPSESEADKPIFQAAGEKACEQWRLARFPPFKAPAENFSPSRKEGYASFADLSH